METVLKFLKILLINALIALLFIHPKQLKSGSPGGNCMALITAALLITTHIKEQPVSMDGGKRKENTFNAVLFAL